MRRSVLLWVWLCAALALLTTARGAFYSSSDHVVELDPSNFEREVTQSDALWLVEFYAPWCGHCQRLTPEWKRAAAALRGVAKVGAVDGERHGALAERYGVKGFPDIKVFGADKSAPPEDYRGGRGSRDIADAALSAVRALVKDRLAGDGGKSTGSKGSGGGSKGGSKSSGRSGGASGSSSKNSDVVELTDGNFDQLVLQGGGGGGDGVDVWMVEFFAPWCGHCKSLEPEWAAAATAARERTGGKVRLGAVDATVHRGLAGRYAISGFPTIKIFRRGGDDGKPTEPPEDYQGGRSRGEIAAKAEELFAETPPPPEPLQEILGEDVFGKACGGERQLCVVAVLPHVLDSGAAGRNAYLELVRKSAAKQHHHRRAAAAWGWLWAEAGAQPDLEAALGVGSLGYPVMAAVNARKARAAVLRGSFGESGIGEFLAELSVAGRGGGGSASAAAPVTGFTVPKIHKVEAWDGKDGQLPLVEEYDLSNVEL